MGIWKPSRKLVEDLEANGLRTRAVVVKIARAGSTSGRSSGGESGPERFDPIDATSRVRTTVRITRPNGEVAEVRTRLTFRAGGVPAVGDTVPVIYDPADPDRVVVDARTHLAEVSARYGAPTTVIGAGEVFFTNDGSAVGLDVPGVLEAATEARAQVDSARQAHLAQMTELHRQGVLDDAQYEMIRQQILGR